MICSVAGCERERVKRTYCAAHYRRFQRHGDVMDGVPLRSTSPQGEPLEWLMQNIGYDGADCLRWPFYSKPDGYGTIFLNGKTTNACAVMCREVNGEPPSALHEAAHSCGNGHLGCVHPKHLRWATHHENGLDSLAHGRHALGEMRTNSKMTEIDVIELRAAASSGVSHSVLAERFGISRGQVSLIRTGKRWGWLKEGLTA